MYFSIPKKLGIIRIHLLSKDLHVVRYASVDMLKYIFHYKVPISDLIPLIVMQSKIQRPTAKCLWL